MEKWFRQSVGATLALEIKHEVPGAGDSHGCQKGNDGRDDRRLALLAFSGSG